MDKIQFNSVIPKVFSQLPSLESEVWNTDITFEKGHLYLIEADSGKGKSTFCSYIVGYRHDYSGQVLFDAQDTKGFKVSEWVNIRKNHISHLFQELRLFPELTAFENVQIKNKLTNFKSENQIKTWFEALGIAEKLDVKVGLLSFGQQQRVAMIRALDDKNSEIMGQIMLDEAQAQGAGVIVTSIGKHMNLNYERIFKL